MQSGMPRPELRGYFTPLHWEHFVLQARHGLTLLSSVMFILRTYSVHLYCPESSALSDTFIKCHIPIKNLKCPFLNSIYFTFHNDFKIIIVRSVLYCRVVAAITAHKGD